MMVRLKAVWRAAKAVLLLAAAFVVTAYFVLPLAWKHYEHEPALEGLSMRTKTAQNIPGDPLNIGLIGDKDEVSAAFQRIGWVSADALGVKSDLEIAGSVVLDRPYVNAPVSSLYYEGRAEDMAFEKSVGASADQRHHIRLWNVLDTSADGRPLWLGAVSFDKGVGFSHFTGQITHHIDGNLDAERDGLVKDLADARIVTRLFQVSGIGPTLTGRNGGGDSFFTDGEVTVATLSHDSKPDAGPPDILENPPLVRLKQTIWAAFAAH